ncbi:hypothetical protein [Streptomyces sp. NPDC002788]
MTTCSSSPRSNEPAIPDEPNGSAQPSAETTVTTGTYQVEQTSTQPAAGAYEPYGPPQPGRPGTEPAAAPGSRPAAGTEPAVTAQAHARASTPGPDQPDRRNARAAAPGPHEADRAHAHAAGAGPIQADQASARAVAPAPDQSSAQSAARRPGPATDYSAPPGQDWLDPEDARPAPPGQDGRDPAKARPAAPALDRTDRPPAGPARPPSSGPDEAARPAARGLEEPAQPAAPGRNEAAEHAGPGPQETEQPNARPFVIRSLDDNPVELRPETGPAGGAPYGDAVSDLVHTAVVDRPLEEVVDLITSLEESPDHTRARAAALRTAGLARPVEDVSRLIALLTKPPRDADCADEAIRAAAHRPVEEVTRLVTLLHEEPQEPHVREEALRAAATGRSVGELVELIDRLGLERLDRNGRPAGGTSSTDNESGKPEVSKGRAAHTTSAAGTHRTLDAPSAERATDRLARSVSWSGRLAALALAVCALAHYPLDRGDASLRMHALALGLSVLCTVLALLLALRPVALVLAGAVLVPTVLAGAQAYGSSFPSASLARAVNLALAPPWLAAAVAVCAALLSLVALAFRVLAPIAARQWAAVPTEAGRTAE